MLQMVSCAKERDIKEKHYSPYMAIEKPNKCMATFRGFDKVLTQKYQIGKDLVVKICNVASVGHCSFTRQVWNLD